MAVQKFGAMPPPSSAVIHNGLHSHSTKK